MFGHEGFVFCCATRACRGHGAGGPWSRGLRIEVAGRGEVTLTSADLTGFARVARHI